MAENDVVEVGTPLFVLEAMKMESTITSHLNGRIKKIYLKEGELVEQDDLVVEIEGWRLFKYSNKKSKISA